MKTYISMLRGINVSGRNMIKMDALRNMYESLNFKNVKTYIQSGNVIFKTKTTEPKALEKMIASQIKKEFGFDIPVMIKDSEELTTVFNQNPFITEQKKDITKLHLTFLSEKPQKVAFDMLKEGQYAEDEFIIIDKAVYLFCPNGYGNTKLTNSFFESKFKVIATTRNWKTITELVNMAEQIDS